MGLEPKDQGLIRIYFRYICDKSNRYACFIGTEMKAEALQLK